MTTPAASQIFDIIRANVCGLCRLDEGKGECMSHRQRCHDRYRRQAVAIYEQVVKPLEEAQTWRPIETAPKSGREILIYLPRSNKNFSFSFVTVGYWEHYESYWHEPVPGNPGKIETKYGAGFVGVFGKNKMRLYPTHWMPLPEPPKEASE